MSGGVDSSVAAALLKKQGFFVAGAYMKNFSEESWAGVVAAECPWRQDMADAQAVCEKLSIEFRSFNFEKEYADRVIEYFFAEYAAGRTPNPDIMCNKEIKFGLFLQKALELGFDYIATGHYARVRILNPESGIQESPSFNSSPLVGEERWGGGDVGYQLLKGVDLKKDQSYFLCELNQEQLSKTLFPIGEYTKTQVRELARNFGLPNAEKKDSQGVCFIGHINLREFLKQRIPERVGEIVTTTGQVIGQHRGAAYYTIGQREGIGVGGGMPYYVVQKDVVKNRLVVSTKLARPPKLSGGRVEGPPGLYTKSVSVSDIHWIGEAPKLPLKCSAKIRYQQPDQECVVRLCEDSDVTSEDEAIPKSNGTASHKLAMTKERVLNVEFKEPQFASAPGQTMVFYDGNRVLGGGIIQQE